MKLKIIFCLALVLGGGLFNFTNIAQSADVPVGVRLAGHASLNGRSWQFEIVMEGYDLYYRKEWSGDLEHNKLKSDGFYNVALDINNFGGETGDALSEMDGERGGGHFGEYGKDKGEVARRLWRGDKFRGVTTNELLKSVEYGHDTEEFLEPVSLEHFPIPCVIKWTDNTSAMPERTTTYAIEKVEFICRHNPQFWADARKKYFNFSEQQSEVKSTRREP